MDVVFVVGFFVTLFVFEPGNEKINDYCRAAVAGETEEVFESRKACWSSYHEYREEIPELGDD